MFEVFTETMTMQEAQEFFKSSCAVSKFSVKDLVVLTPFDDAFIRAQDPLYHLDNMLAWFVRSISVGAAKQQSDILFNHVQRRRKGDAYRKIPLPRASLPNTARISTSVRKSTGEFIRS